MILLGLLVLLPVAIPAVKNARLEGSDEADGNEDAEFQLAKGAKADINLASRQSCHEIDEDYPSQAEKSCGGENMPKEPDFSTSNTKRRVTEPAEDNAVIDAKSNSRDGREEERHRETEAEEEIKSTIKFCYFSTGISVAGNISIFSGYLGDQTGHAHKVPLEVCSLLMTTTFVSGASMLVLTSLRRSIRISIKFFRSLKYTTFVFLTLTMLSVSIIFLKMRVILAFIPTLFVVVIAFIMARHPCSDYQGHRAMSFRRRSLLPV